MSAAPSYDAAAVRWTSCSNKNEKEEASAQERLFVRALRGLCCASTPSFSCCDAGHQPVAPRQGRRSCASSCCALLATPVSSQLPRSQDLVRESERRRYADPAQVDKVIELDQAWRDGACVAAPRPVAARAQPAPRSALQAGRPEQGVQRVEQSRGQAQDSAHSYAGQGSEQSRPPTPATQAKEDAAQEMEQCASLDKQRLVAEARPKPGSCLALLTPFGRVRMRRRRQRRP